MKIKRALGLISGLSGFVAFSFFIAPSALAQSVPSSCPSAAVQDSVGFSLQQLTEVANNMLLENLPSNVVTADQNLLSAIEQVILQITAACSPSGSPSPISAPVSTYAPNPTEPTTPSPTPTNPISPVSSPVSPAPSTSAAPQFSLDGGIGGSYPIGAPWTLTLTSSYDATPFTLCDIQNGSQSCTPNWGTTNTDGNWVGNGNFGPSTSGSWTEWVVFPSGATSNKISFTIAEPSSISMPSNIIVGVQGYDPTTLAYTDGTAGINTYVIVYGNFANAGNIVAINGAAVVPASQVANQIDVSLAGIPAATQNTITVTTPAGAEGSASFAITSAGGSSVPAPVVPVGPSCSGSLPLATSFPVTVVVTVNTLNVRSSPSSAGSLSGSGTLSKGDVFTATNEVQGGCVNSNDWWWVSSSGNYVWSGGTAVQATISSPTPTTPSPVIPTPTPTPTSPLSSPVTKTITSGGTSYSVTYSYLPDGEAQAAFTFTYPNVSTNFPVAARGTQGYVYQAGQAGLEQSNGSVQALNQGADCGNFYGAAGCVELNGTFTALIGSIKASMPANVQLAPGITFSTPPGTAAGTYMDYALYPVSITTDSYGNILSVQSINASGYGSGIKWYNLGGGDYVQTTDGSHYVLEGPSVPSGDVVVVENFSVATGAGGLPASVSGNLALETNSQLASTGYADLSSQGVYVTFPINASSPTAVATAVNQKTGSGGGKSNEPSGAIINYCIANPFDAYCATWLYCIQYPNDPACVNLNNSCPINSTNPSCPTSIPPSTPTTASPGSTATTTLAEVCTEDPSSPGCPSGPKPTSPIGGISGVPTLQVTLVGATSGDGFEVRALKPSSVLDFNNSYSESENVSIPVGDTFAVFMTHNGNPAGADYGEISGVCDGTAVTGATYACTATFTSAPATPVKGSTCSTAQASEAACNNNNTCMLDEDGDPGCFCKPGYIPNGGSTADCIAESSVTDSCYTNPSDDEVTCLTNGACTLDGSGQLSCECDEGYVLNPEDSSECIASDEESSCMPGAVQNCDSSSNSCGMTNPGTNTCGSDGTWDGCTAEPPSEASCE